MAQKNCNKTAQDYADIIRATTPIIIAVIGGLIGIVALLSPEIKDNKLTSAMGLAGTAIAGGSGLAQSTKSETSTRSETNAGGSDLAQSNKSETSSSQTKDNSNIQNI